MARPCPSACTRSPPAPGTSMTSRSTRMTPEPWTSRCLHEAYSWQQDQGLSCILDLRFKRQTATSSHPNVCGHLVLEFKNPGSEREGAPRTAQLEHRLGSKPGSPASRQSCALFSPPGLAPAPSTVATQGAFAGMALPFLMSNLASQGKAVPPETGGGCRGSPRTLLSLSGLISQLGLPVRGQPEIQP